MCYFKHNNIIHQDLQIRKKYVSFACFFLQNRKAWNIIQLRNSLRVIEDNTVQIQVQIQIVHDVIYTVPSKCPAAVL